MRVCTLWATASASVADLVGLSAQVPFNRCVSLRPLPQLSELRSGGHLHERHPPPHAVIRQSAGRSWVSQGDRDRITDSRCAATPAPISQMRNFLYVTKSSGAAFAGAAVDRGRQPCR